MAGHIIYVHTTLAAPPEVVWDVIADVAHADRIFRSVKRSEPVTEDAFDVGTCWREERTLFGHHGLEDRRVVECDPPRRAVIETKVGHDVVRTAFRITPFGVGDQCRLAMNTNLDTSGRSGLGKIEWTLFGSFSYERTHKMLERDMEDIEAEVERRVGGAGKHAA